MSRFPDFLIIGAMKCATSTLHAQLRRQPGIFMTEPKEPNFFSDDDVYDRGIAWYRDLFAGAAPGDLCGESSTHYTKLPTFPRTVERMKKHLGDVRLIYVLRHPVDRLLSQFVHEWTERQVDGPLELALERRPELVQYSLYATQLEPYFAAYGQDSVLPVFFERLTSNPQRELERVGGFLGIGATPRWDEGVTPQNVSRERMRKSAVRDAVVHAPVLATLRRRFVPKSVRNRVRAWWTLREPPRLSDKLVQVLESRFDADLERLSSWIGFPLSCQAFRRMRESPESAARSTTKP